MSNSSNYEDERYLYFSQEEMDKEEGTLFTFNERSHILEFASYSEPIYIYELVEVVIPRVYEEEGAIEDKEQKRPIKVTYV